MLDLIKMLPRPPENWNDIEGWDKYWKKVLLEDQWYINLKLFKDLDLLKYVDDFRERDIRSILFVGNGISQIPKLFTIFGFKTTALDVSKIATETANSFEIEYRSCKRRMKGYLKINKKKWLEFLNSNENFEYRCGNLFNILDAPGPFDSIVSTRTLQGFTTDSNLINKAIECIDQRLSKSGLFVNLVMNSRFAFNKIEAILQRFNYYKASDFFHDKSKKIVWNWIASG